QRLRDRLIDLPGVAHVAGHRQRSPPVLPYLGGDRLQRRHPTATRHHVGADLGQLDRDGAPDALAGARHDGHAIAQRVGGEPHLLDDRVGGGDDARDLDLLAVDQRRHPGRDLVLPVVALVDGVVQALALALVLEPPDPHVDALVLFPDEAAQDHHAHLDLEGNDLLLHALDPLGLLARTDVVLPQFEEHPDLLARAPALAARPRKSTPRALPARADARSTLIHARHRVYDSVPMAAAALHAETLVVRTPTLGIAYEAS